MTAIIWELSSGKISKKLDGHLKSINSVAISPDS